MRRDERGRARLGLDQTSYANPIGLDEAGNYSSARDLAALTLELRATACSRRIFDTAEYDTTSGARPRQLVNRNMLVLTVPWVERRQDRLHARGRHTCSSARASATGSSSISVVLGAPSEAERDAGDPRPARVRVLAVSARAPDRASGERAGVGGGPLPGRDPAADRRARRRASRRETRTSTVAVDAPDEVEGPIERGERLGRATVTLDGELVERVPLRAARSVAEASVLERFDAAVPGPRACRVAVAVGGCAGWSRSALALVRRRRGGAPSRAARR